MYGDDTDNGPREAGSTPSVPEAQKILQGLLADLPDEAQTLVDKVDREVARIQQQKEDDVARIRDEAERRVDEVDQKAEKRRQGILQHTVEQLEPMQKELFRSGELGKALGTFALIQILKARVLNVMPDPGNMVNFAEVGKTFYFQITGSNQGPVWGTDAYTSDSHVATAAVHAGALEAGEDGVVKVTLVDMTNLPIQGSMRHGVMSMNWGAYRVGYRLRRT